MIFFIKALVIGFTDTEFSLNEGDGNVTLTIRVRGGTTQCNETDWIVSFNITPESAQCKSESTFCLSNLTT